MNCLRVCSDWCSYVYNLIEHERGMHELHCSVCYELLDACSNLVRIIGANICSYTVSNITL